MAAGAMDDLADRFADRGVTSVFVYTREAHPGEHYRHHTSMDDKRRNAAAFREHSAVRRRILLDDLDGAAHHGYGLLPNMTWIVMPGGRIAYKAAWTAAEDVESALAWTLDHLERRRSERLVPLYSERLAWRRNDPAAFRAGLERAGPQAVRDFYGDK
jgi:hypothetical protein